MSTDYSRHEKPTAEESSTALGKPTSEVNEWRNVCDEVPECQISINWPGASFGFTWWDVLLILFVNIGTHCDFWSKRQWHLSIYCYRNTMSKTQSTAC